MKTCRVLSIFSVTVSLLLTTAMTHADELDEWSGHIGVFIGAKILDSGDWPGDTDIHNSSGYLFDIKKKSWPISIVLDILDTGGENKHDGMKDLGHTTEGHFGVRKIFMNQNEKIQSYIGGGIAYMSAEQNIEVNNIMTIERDDDVGGWLGVGMYYDVSLRFALGFDVRYSHGEAFLFNKERNIGGIFISGTGTYKF